MGLSLLAPLFLAGLIAVSIPVLVHLTNRDRKDVVRFPSLKFLTKLPYRQMRRQRIQHWFLFALRTLAIILLVAAFTRPLIEGSLVGTTPGDPGREVIVVLDLSYSMWYGDTWERAVDAAHEVVSRQSPNSRLSLVGFAEQAQVIVAPTTDRSALTGALDTLEPGSGTTRLAGAIQLGNQLLLESPLAEREVVLISDWQTSAWDRGTETGLIPGTTLTPVHLGTPAPANALITAVEARRSGAGGRRSVVMTARVANQGQEAVEVPVALEVNGEVVFSTTAALPPAGSQSVRLGPIAQPSTTARTTIRLGDDLLTPDNTFHLALFNRPPLSVLLVETGGADASLYLRQALEIAEDPEVAFHRRAATRVRATDVRAAMVVILHDGPFPGGATGQALIEHVADGGGLWIVLGGSSRLGSWTDEAQRILPGQWRQAVDRLSRQGARLASVDYQHPAFRIFSGPDDGNIASPRFYRYRPIILNDSAVAIARYTDGAVAMAGLHYGRGRVLLWGSPFDNRWSDLPVQPVFLPFVHQVTQYLGGNKALDGWREAGEVADLREVLREMDIDSDTLNREIIIEGPGGSRRHVELRTADPFLTLGEAGFYEVYPLGQERAGYPVAVNVNRRESDLTMMDIDAFVAATTSPDTGTAMAFQGVEVTPEERERRQGTWWFLLVGAVALLMFESLWSNRSAPGHDPTLAQTSAGRRRAGVE